MANALSSRVFPFYCLVLLSLKCTHIRSIGLCWKIIGPNLCCTSRDRLRSHTVLTNSLNGLSLFSYFASSTVITETEVSANLPLLYLTLKFGLILGRGTGTHC